MFQDLSEVTHYYQPLSFLNCDILDEFILLVTQLLKDSESKRIELAKEEYKKARSLINSGDRAWATTHAANAYETLYFKGT